MRQYCPLMTKGLKTHMMHENTYEAKRSKLTISSMLVAAVSDTI